MFDEVVARLFLEFAASLLPSLLSSSSTAASSAASSFATGVGVLSSSVLRDFVAVFLPARRPWCPLPFRLVPAPRSAFHSRALDEARPSRLEVFAPPIRWVCSSQSCLQQSWRRDSSLPVPVPWRWGTKSFAFEAKSANGVDLRRSGWHARNFLLERRAIAPRDSFSFDVSRSFLKSGTLFDGLLLLF